MKRNNFVSLLFIAIGLCASIRASAKSSDSAPAVSAYKRGEKLFSQKKYSEALSQFAQGYALTKKPGFLYNMAECARLMGDGEQAYTLYRRYIVDHPTGKQRVEVIAQCRALNRGACENQNATPKTPIAIRPTQMQQAATIKPAQPDLNIAPSTTASSYVAISTPAPAAPATKPFYKKWPFWTGVGAVVVAGSVTAIVLATRASGDPQLPAADYVVDFK